MAADSFTEALHRLREIHDKEVIGMQAKLTELTVEKCRDAQRIEELFSKNHILREQHKVLNENIKVLENRLRAGLCDRCKVTQELAKKKQQEFENAHFLSLQQISALTNEMNSLKEENRSLFEDLKVLKSLDERNRNSKSFTPEANRSSVSPQAHLAAGNQKNGLEKPFKDGETQEQPADHLIPEEKGLGSSRRSPEEKSLQTTSADINLIDMGRSGAQKLNLSSQNPQRISNQLHGTIAVLRSKGGQTGPAPTQAQMRRSSTSEIQTKGSCADFYEASAHIESMSQHLAQKRLGERASEAPVEGTSRYLIAKSREAVLETERPQEDWEERAAMVELHNALLYMREHGYRGTMIHPNHRDRLHYILSRQHQGIRLPQSPDDILKSQRKEDLDEGELSLLQVLRTRWKNKYQDSQPKEQEWDENEAKYLEKEQREADEEEMTPDKPLDLSDTKRGQHSHLSDKKELRRMYESYSANPLFGSKCSPPTRTSSTDMVFAEGQENTWGQSMGLETKHSRESKTCSNTEDFQDAVMEPKSCLEMDRDSVGKRSSRGQKRDRGCDLGDVQTKDVPSPQEDEEEEDMSYSETETESTHHATPGPDRDFGTKDKLHDKARWTQKAPLASRKSVKKKKRGLNYAAQSDMTQQGDHDKMFS